MRHDTDCDEQILADYFFLKHRRLQIFRVEQRGSATVLWTSRAGLLRYLQALQDELMRRNKRSY